MVGGCSQWRWSAGLYGQLRRRGVPDGRVFLLYLGGYGVIRFVVQFFRGDDAVWGLAHSQYTAVAMVAVAALLARWWRAPV